MKYKDLLESQEQYVLNLRREFHMYPEESWKEFRTSKRIKEELDKIGIEYYECAKTGVVGVIRGKENGKTVALRADMDALKIKEENNIEYRSKNEGIMHACGHDGHTAMLLGAAKALYSVKEDIQGNVKLIFQPAEELVQGASKMVNEGVVEDVDGIMGVHLWNDVPTGKINIEAGPRMASGDYVVVDFYGKGGHGSLPHQAVDPIVVASSFIMNSNTIISREKSPLDSAVFTLGEVKAGTRFNVISQKAHLEGTLRCFNEQTRKDLTKAIKRHAEETAESYRATVEVNIHKGTPPTINDKNCSSIAAETAEKIVGKGNLINLEKTTGSEDMAYYLEKVPGLIAFVGSGYEEENKSYPHHHPRFNINEDSLNIGLSLYFNFAMDFLNK